MALTPAARLLSPEVKDPAVLSLPISSSLVRAVLVMYEPPPAKKNTPGPECGRLAFQFNPEQLRIANNASWVRHPAKNARKARRPQFRGTQPRSFSVEIFLDAAGKRGRVQDSVELLMKCCTPTQESVTAKRPSPPWVRLVWGKMRTTAFTAVVHTVSASYTMFAPDGQPLRATCTVDLEELGGAVPRTNPTSGGPGGVGAHQVARGESLATLSYRTYGDPTRWREVARLNEIDDPSLLAPGDQLLLPDLTASAWGGSDGQ